MLKRKLGKSGIETSAMGLGCWEIGGPTDWDGSPAGWGQVDDTESINAIHHALEKGISIFDTSNSYGAGHSEIILGEALKNHRDQVVIMTKFGFVIEEGARKITGKSASPEDIRNSCEASLRRLQTDVIDVFLFHLMNYDVAEAGEVRDTLEELVTEGKIRYYGWSTDNTDSARFFAQGEHCTVIEHMLNIFQGNREILDICDEYNVASVNRSPLAMGILTGKLNDKTTFAKDDFRNTWDMEQGEKADFLKKLESIREVLTSDGRTLVQGALGYLWALSDRTIPITGFTSVEHVEENSYSLQQEPLSKDQAEEIRSILEP